MAGLIIWLLMTRQERSHATSTVALTLPPRVVGYGSPKGRSPAVSEKVQVYALQTLMVNLMILRRIALSCLLTLAQVMAKLITYGEAAVTSETTCAYSISRLSEGGAATVYINQVGINPANWVPLNGGKPIATGVGAMRRDVQFADIDGDRSKFMPWAAIWWFDTPR